MKIVRLTREVFDNHLGICSEFLPGYFFYSTATPPSADYLRRIMFYSEQRNTSFLLFDENNAKIIGLVLFHLYDDNACSMSMDIMLVPGGYSGNDIAQILKPVVIKIMEAYKLNSVRSTVAEFEDKSVLVLEAAGFLREVHYKEHIFVKGGRSDAFMYSIYGGSQC